MTKREQLQALARRVWELETLDKLTLDRLADLTHRVETLELSVSTRDYRVPLPEVTDSHGNRRSLLVDFQESVPAPLVPSTPDRANVAGRTYFVPGNEGWKVYTLDVLQHAWMQRARASGRSIPDALAELGVEPEPREGVAP